MSWLLYMNHFQAGFQLAYLIQYLWLHFYLCGESILRESSAPYTAEHFQEKLYQVVNC